MNNHNLSPDTLQRLGPRLRAIGSYEVGCDADGLDIHWVQPTSLGDLGFRVDVIFANDTDSGHFDPDEQMLTLWDRFSADIDQHAALLRQEMLRVYRTNQSYFVEQDEFPPDLPDTEVLKLLRGTILLQRHEERGKIEYWLSVSIAALWNGEHAWDFEYDADTHSFSEPSKG